MTQAPPGFRSQFFRAQRDEIWENQPPLAGDCEHEFYRMPLLEFRQTVLCSRCGGLNAEMSAELTEHPGRFADRADHIDRLGEPRSIGLFEVMLLTERVIVNQLLERLAAILEQDEGVPAEAVARAVDVLFDPAVPSADAGLLKRMGQESDALYTAAPRWLGVPAYGSRAPLPGCPRCARPLSEPASDGAGG